MVSRRIVCGVLLVLTVMIAGLLLESGAQWTAEWVSHDEYRSLPGDYPIPRPESRDAGRTDRVLGVLAAGASALGAGVVGWVVLRRGRL